MLGLVERPERLPREEGGGFRSFVVAQHTHGVAVELVNAAWRTDRYEHVLFTQRLGDGECLGITLKVLTGIVFRETSLSGWRPSRGM